MATQSTRIAGVTDPQGRTANVTVEYDDVTNVASLVRCVNNTDAALLCIVDKTDPATGVPIAGEHYEKTFPAQLTDVVNLPTNGPHQIVITWRAPGKPLGYVVQTVYPAP